MPDNNLQVQENDLRQLNKTTVALRDGSGYLASLEVLHQLHCLVRTHCPETSFLWILTRGNSASRTTFASISFQIITSKKAMPVRHTSVSRIHVSHSAIRGRLLTRTIQRIVLMHSDKF